MIKSLKVHHRLSEGDGKNDTIPRCDWPGFAGNIGDLFIATGAASRQLRCSPHIFRKDRSMDHTAQRTSNSCAGPWPSTTLCCHSCSKNCRARPRPSGFEMTG